MPLDATTPPIIDRPDATTPYIIDNPKFSHLDLRFQARIMQALKLDYQSKTRREPPHISPEMITLSFGRPAISDKYELLAQCVIDRRTYSCTEVRNATPGKGNSWHLGLYTKEHHERERVRNQSQTGPSPASAASPIASKYRKSTSTYQMWEKEKKRLADEKSRFSRFNDPKEPGSRK